MSLVGGLRRGYQSRSKTVKKFINWWTRHYYGCDIPCDLQIGSNVQFGHSGLGVVISPYSKVGNNVFFQHGVTLGATKGIENAPIVNDRVIIGAHATLIGKITIGSNSIIGAAAIVTKDVPENSIVLGTNLIRPIDDEM